MDSKVVVKLHFFLLVAVACLMSGFGIAGTPDEDPVVARLRAEFEKGAVPTLDQIHLGGDWNCSEYSAKETDFSFTEDQRSYRFSEYNSLIRNSGEDTVKTFSFISGKGLAGSSASGTSFIRVSSEGGLLVEKAKTVADSKDSTALKSVADDRRDVVSYAVCPLSQTGPTLPADGSCGTSGSVEERIQNCNTSRQSSKGVTWALVTRTATHTEVWKDPSSGLLWGDHLEDMMNHDDAREACGKELSLEARGNITSVTWQLPSIDDYKQAEEHGIREILPNMLYWFWSSSVLSDYRDYAWLFYGGYGNVYYGNRFYGNSVRCVAR